MYLTWLALAQTTLITATLNIKKNVDNHHPADSNVANAVDCNTVVARAVQHLEASISEAEAEFSISFASPLKYLKKFQHVQDQSSQDGAEEDQGSSNGPPSSKSLPADLMECATQKSHVESIKVAADLSLFGLYGVQVNTSFAALLIQSLMDTDDLDGKGEGREDGSSAMLSAHERIIKVAPMASFATGSSADFLARSYRQLGLLYATGLGVKRDYAQALVYASLAAIEGDLIAHQLLAYWYHAGIGVPRDCTKSVWHYQRVADAIKDISSQDPSGSRKWPKSPMALDEDGLYGKGASGSGNPALQRQKKENAHISEADLLLVYKLQADAGDVASQFMLGQCYYLGNSATPIDYSKALLYLTKAAAQYPSHIELDGGDDGYKTAKLAASNAAGYLGIMYARGEGVPVDLDISKQWFERGVQQENALSHSWLGRMYLRGIGVDADYEKGITNLLSTPRSLNYGFPTSYLPSLLGIFLLKEASKKGDADGKALLAEELLSSDQGIDYTEIMGLLEGAAKKNSMLAYYQLGRLHASGQGNVGGQAKCSAALKYLKAYVERGLVWVDEDMARGEEAFRKGVYQSSLVYYLFVAERGVQAAQMNAAILLDSGKASPFNVFNEGVNSFQAALPLYLRAANQGHLDARVRVGDLYYYGYTFSNSSIIRQDNLQEAKDAKEREKSWYATLPLLVGRVLNQGLVTRPNYTMAFAHYSAAAEGENTHSSIAMFNLGWMYENGLGVEQDYPLAKRWYDLALTTNPGSFLPVHLATTALAIKWTVWDILSFIRGLFSLQSGKNPNSLKRKSAPLPGQSVEELEEAVRASTGSDGGIDFEATVVAFLCLIVCVLFYYRNGVLAEAAVANAPDPVPGPVPVPDTLVADVEEAPDAANAEPERD